jgi:hypothetical protein
VSEAARQKQRKNRERKRETQRVGEEKTDKREGEGRREQ